MGKCVSCGKKGLFLKLSSAGLCSECAEREEQKAEQERKTTEEKYAVLATAYSAIEPFRRCIDKGDVEGMEKCIAACEEFDLCAKNTEMTSALAVLIAERATSRFHYYELPDFKATAQYNDDLKDAARTIGDLQQTALYRKNLLTKARNKTVEFKHVIENLSRCEIVISEFPAKKGSISEVSEITFSNITKKTPRDKLGNFVVIDTETTGLSASKAEIVEISAIRFREFKPVECFTTLCNPKKGISEEASQINGITSEMVKDKPPFDLVAQALQDFIRDDNIVGHNLEFDLKFIVKHGVNLDGSKRKYYDTLSIAQRTLKKVKEKWDKEYGEYVPNYDSDYDVDDYKLKTLCDYYDIPLVGAHRALVDCYATGLLLECLAKDRE